MRYYVLSEEASTGCFILKDQHGINAFRSVCFCECFWVWVSLTCTELPVDCLTGVWAQHTLNAETIVWPWDQIIDLITCALDKHFFPWFPLHRLQAKKKLRNKKEICSPYRGLKINFQLQWQWNHDTFLVKKSCIFTNVTDLFVLIWLCTVHVCNVLGHSYWLWLCGGH